MVFHPSQVVFLNGNAKADKNTTIEKISLVCGVNKCVVFK